MDLPKLLAKGWDDINVVHGVFGSACYITDSWPSLLYLAYKYAGAARRVSSRPRIPRRCSRARAVAARG